MAWNLLARGVPNRFEATLLQSGNTLAGSILDDNYLGEAKLSGEVIGRRIQFTKRYLATSPDPVNYIGALAESEDFMHGQWHLGYFNSGFWEARRSGEDLMANLKARLADQIPVLCRASVKGCRAIEVGFSNSIPTLTCCHRCGAFSTVITLHQIQ